MSARREGAAISPEHKDQASVLSTDDVGTLTLETGHKVTGNGLGVEKWGQGEDGRIKKGEMGREGNRISK